MCPDPRQELADIISQAAEYVAWLKDDGVAQLEVGRGSLPSRTAAKATGGTDPQKRSARPSILPNAGTPPISAARPAPAAHVRVTGLPDIDNQGESVKAGLAKIAGEVAVCTRCALHSTRTNTVPGQGNPRPEIMFIGEAPGADEDKQGLAFVGRAGQLLTKMIEAMGFTREEVFIANIVKCRPPDNRPPTPEEMDTCIPYLKRQIAQLQPKVIVALGATSVQGLLGLTGITKLRGRWHTYEGIDLMPTLHPAYLLRNPPAKKDVWADLQEVLKRLGRTPPPVKKPG